MYIETSPRELREGVLSIYSALVSEPEMARQGGV